MKAVRRLALAFSLALPALLLACLTFASPALAAECPNEQLRQESAVNAATGQPYSAALPDCRAYELVTPAAGDHGGLAAGVRAVSADGETVAYGTNVAFGESAGSPVVSLFEAQRDSAGWATTARNAPATLKKTIAITVVPVSADATRILFEFGNTSEQEAAEYFIGEPDGEFVGTVPYTPGISTKFDAASPDFGTIVFSAGAVNTDDYQITGAGGSSSQLQRLGVNEAGEVISECGTYVGSSLGTTTVPGSTMGGSNFHAISEDGDAVLFTAMGHSEPGCSPATIAPAVDELYAQIDGTQSVDISEPSAADCSACQTSASFQNDAIFQGASADGTKVFFSTKQELLPGQKTENLYEYDFDAAPKNKITLVSTGAASPEVQGVVRISNDGSHVYFVARAVLTTAKNGEEQEAHAGADNLYVYESETGETSFVAMLCSGSEASGTVSDPACPVSLSSAVNDSALWGADAERRAQSTPDGQYLVFDSYGDLTPDKTSTAQAVYLYDAATGSLVRASVGQAGYDDDGNNDAYGATIIGPHHTVEEEPAVDTSDLGSVSEDGDVFFDSSEALSEGAVAGVEHVYEYHEGQVYLISDGQDQGGAEFDRATLSGSDVFFSSDEALVGQDESPGTQSIYDARIDGGFPAPAAAVPPCSGEACQGALSPPPLLGSPTSAAFTGGANVLPTAQPNPEPKITKPLTRAQKLSKALKSCRSKHNKGKRASCRRQAGAKYRAKVKTKVKKTDRRGR